jgi:putative lipase involved disintegration of autophagic bodies
MKNLSKLYLGILCLISLMVSLQFFTNSSVSKSDIDNAAIDVMKEVHSATDIQTKRLYTRFDIIEEKLDTVISQQDRILNSQQNIEDQNLNIIMGNTRIEQKLNNAFNIKN